jgi:CRISPR-associated protein Cmr1
VEQLRKREGEIWGTTESPSPVLLWVSGVTKGEVGPWAKYEQDPRGDGVKSTPDPVDHNYPKYALFPFQGETEKVGRIRRVKEYPAMVTKNVSFKLNLQWPVSMDITMDVEASVWAWINFGGLGARTRRGCGSLLCEGLAPTAENLDDIQQWYLGRLEHYGVNKARDIRPWPTLPGQLLISYNREKSTGLMTPMQAWSQVMWLLQTFRQGENIGRGQGNGKRLGRSFWPEADSLRGVTGHSFPAHKKPITTNDKAFPRAEFGLPIIFHFKDGPSKGSRDIPNRDPAKRQLLPVGGTERMASPLILKALAMKPDQALPMILKLKTQLPDGVIVKSIDFDEKEHSFGSDKIRRSDLCSYPHSPMSGRSQNGSAMEAFINFAREEGFR